ncbi:hypothetical protein [Clostridium fallax]|uniref:Uncharacterized protein n=1 Tax=Clostridium fallax TaxID=1533 RepID=A0A1M4T627_9CLOT|nr:hypothetical protein [Clostridium fallax]SHE40003.1 hypothetical protein SAMN05443638_10239 [Clostridium fallax]SQB22618.1 Uncharacterised protein [Clostridium fallax]
MDSLNYNNFNFSKEFFRFYDNDEGIDEVGEYEVDIPFTYTPELRNDNSNDEKRPYPFNNPNTNMKLNIPPAGPPPFSTPSKNNQKVQKLNLSSPSQQKISSNSLRPCLYRFTYIWQRNGFSYWAFLTSIDRRSISGWRWIGFRWVYFGVDLRRIDSFICY